MAPSTSTRRAASTKSTSPEKPPTRAPSPPLKSITDLSAAHGVEEEDEDVKLKTRGTGTEGIGKGVPAFLVKLFSMINDPATDSLIYWSTDGLSFFIPNHQAFGSTLLPQFFKHANFTSFVRQLNMYGFKKVPHLQTAALSTFHPTPTRPSSSSSSAPVPPGPELWEFTNPKFMRSRPELLGGITRKKSAKEVAAARALEEAERRAGGKGKKGGGGGSEDEEGEEEEGDVDMDPPHPSHAKPAAGGSKPAQAEQALVPYSHLLSEVSALKTSNDLLWRQAMTAREEQERSQKKLDGVIRFLAGQFGGMNVGMLLEGLGGDDVKALGGAEAGGSGKGKGKEVGSPRLGRLRLGKERMIGDGVMDTGTPASSSSATSERGGDGDVEMEDGEEGGKGEEGEEGGKGLWEIGPDGGMRRMNSNPTPSTKSPIRPHHARHGTSSARRAYATLPANGRATSPPSTTEDRFVRLDTSPEGKALDSFEPSGVETPSSGGGGSVGEGAPIFPSQAGGGGQGTAMVPSYMNAMTAYQPSGANPMAGYNLHPEILQMPLGELLASPAGAQLLASLGQGAGALLGHQNLGQALSGGRGYADGQGGGDAGRFQPAYGEAQQQQQGPPTSTMNTKGATSTTAGMQEIKPLDSTNWLNDIPLSDSIGGGGSTLQDEEMLLDPDLLLNNPETGTNGDANNIDWADPQMAAFLEQLAGPPDATPGGSTDVLGTGQFYTGPNGQPYTGTLAAPQGGAGSGTMGDVQPLEFDALFNTYSSPEGSVGGDEAGGELKEPLSKKRKTDQRG